eukprot:5096220-Karenia_brevis.AAC.1
MHTYIHYQLGALLRDQRPGTRDLGHGVTDSPHTKSRNSKYILSPYVDALGGSLMYRPATLLVGAGSNLITTAS